MAAHAPVASHEPATSTGLNNRKVLMWSFLGSECLFFGSLISTYMLYRGHSKNPPFPEQPGGFFNIPYTSVSSFVLLMSSLTMVLALAAIQRGNVRQMRVWLIATAALGGTFLAGQVFEFTTFVEKGLSLSQNLFGTTFFVLTGFHGAHVTIGVVILLTLTFISFTGRIQQENSLTVEIAGLYWHFVDIVWIIIFTVVYLLPG